MLTFKFLLIWFLSVYGITNIVTSSLLFQPIREWFYKTNPKNSRILWLARKMGELLHCPMCFGFWTGAFVGQYWKSLSGDWFIDAVVASGACWAAFSFMWKLEK